MRGAVLRTITLLAAAAVLAGCGAGAPASPGAPALPGAAVGTPAATADVAASATVVMVIRHGEKPEGKTHGVDAQGHEDDSSLTRVGWERAHRLVDLFDPAQGSPRPGLARPVSIYAAGPNDEGEGKRTRETVTPLAERLGIRPDTSFGKGEEEALVEHVLSQPGPVLISWQHGEIPAIAEAFPSVTPTPPSEWPDDRFDMVWTFTKTAQGWHFAQIPQLALPEDEASPIDD
jgi:broad specificity phosphatase PhoE